MNGPIVHYRFTVDDYYRMAEVGILGPEARVELLDGVIFDKPRTTPRDASCNTRLTYLFMQKLGDLVIVSPRNPVRLDYYSEPEPDLTLLRRTDDFYSFAHPGASDVLLLVEVVDGPSDRERALKLPLYARHGVAEVWLIDLEQRQVVVCSDPAPDGYRIVEVARPEQSLRPLAFPNLLVDLVEILG